MAKLAETKGLITVDFLVFANQLVFQTLNYNIRLEVGVQTCEEKLEIQSGSCRDFAWLLVQALSSVGLATRFVSGYLVQLTSDVKTLDGPSGPENDFTDLHAWVEVYLPGAGLDWTRPNFWTFCRRRTHSFVLHSRLRKCCSGNGCE